MSERRLRYARNHRLTTAGDFQRVFDQAYKTSGGGMTVLARKNDRDFPRLGVIVSKKYAKTAVGRNRIKRLVRESFRRNQEILAGLDIIVLGRPGVEGKVNQDIAAALEKHWQKLGQWKRS